MSSVSKRRIECNELFFLTQNEVKEGNRESIAYFIYRFAACQLPFYLKYRLAPFKCYFCYKHCKECESENADEFDIHDKTTLCSPESSTHWCNMVFQWSHHCVILYRLLQNENDLGTEKMRRGNRRSSLAWRVLVQLLFSSVRYGRLSCRASNWPCLIILISLFVSLQLGSVEIEFTCHIWLDLKTNTLKLRWCWKYCNVSSLRPWLSTLLSTVLLLFRILLLSKSQ